MGKKQEVKKTTAKELVPALVLVNDNEVKGNIIPAGTVIFIGECGEGLTINDVNKAIARGNVKAMEAEIEVEGSGSGNSDSDGDGSSE